MVEIAADLRNMGVGSNDRVATVLPNGPEMAIVFIAAAAHATSAPLNPAYRRHEFEFYLSDLDPKILIVDKMMDTPARDVAKERGIAIVELSADSGGDAGEFKLLADSPGSGEVRRPTTESDAALVLHTSGTTSRPKMVPLSEANLCASARNIQEALSLTADDRCLNVMPLFHIHGLVAGVLSSLASGGSIVCTPGFSSADFLDWLEQFRPTWYTAVPTMHHAVLEAVKRSPRITGERSLRFIRSSSAPLGKGLFGELERTFGVPVVESYGMTEAAHQMTSNLLPPGQRKPGSVGVAAGPQVAIMDDAGAILPSGVNGEVVILGENVTQGYENNPEANAKAFTDGWFRTGDQGFMDQDGYLFLTGRLKELINRGGEKISPVEIDEVVLAHPAVSQAVTFAIADKRFGEDVAVALVPRAGASVSEREIRKFVVERLAAFKVPRRIYVVNELPKGSTGKLQRIGMADRLAQMAPQAVSSETGAYEAPSTPLEALLVDVYKDILDVKQVGVLDNFFDLGGDSMSAADAISRLERDTGVAVNPRDLMFQTLRQLAATFESRMKQPARGISRLVSAIRGLLRWKAE